MGVKVLKLRDRPPIVLSMQPPRRWPLFSTARNTRLWARPALSISSRSNVVTPESISRNNEGGLISSLFLGLAHRERSTANSVVLPQSVVGDVIARRGVIAKR